MAPRLVRTFRPSARKRCWLVEVGRSRSALAMPLPVRLVAGRPRTGFPLYGRIIRRLLERLVRHAFEQWFSRPDGLQVQQLGGEMWREDRKVGHMTDDDDSHNREEGRA